MTQRTNDEQLRCLLLTVRDNIVLDLVDARARIGELEKALESIANSGREPSTEIGSTDEQLIDDQRAIIEGLRYRARAALTK